MRTVRALFCRLEGFVEGLAERRMRLWVLVLATALAGTSVGRHRVLDDYVLSAIATGKGPALGLDRGALDLFNFTTGRIADNHRLMDVGLMLPWWTDPQIHIAFFRPLSSLSHFVDERLWPASAVAMHFHSLLWFAAMLGAAALVYERLESSPVIAGFAFLLYAMDDAHGPAVAWLANRNALIATALACVTLAAHDAWRKSRSTRLGLLAVFSFGVALLAGELAIGALAYLVAHAWLRDKGSPWRRLVSLAPYFGVTIVWRGFWVRGGYGARGSGAYIDPLASPLEFAKVFPAKLAMLFHGQFSAPPSDLAFLAPPSHQPLLLTLAALTVVFVLFLLAPILKKDESARFWAAGFLFSLLPLVATFPSDRLLLLAGLGAMALLARLFHEWILLGTRADIRASGRVLLTGVYFVLHVVIAPLLLPIRAWQMELFGNVEDRAVSAMLDESVEKTVVVVGAPTVLFANYIQAERTVLGEPRPEHLYLLAAQSSALRVERSGPAALTIRPAEGFLYTPLERHYRGDVKTLDVGSRVELSSMTATVETLMPDGRPSAVRFDFNRPPDEYRFVAWQNDTFVPFDPPLEGGSMTLPAEDFGQILGRAVREIL